jgi:ribosomal-protein-alanine N-acetyltransferase
MKELGTKSLFTKRLVLRRFKEEDIKPFYENYGSDKKINKYITWNPYSSYEDTKEFIEWNIDKYDDPFFFGWVIVYHDEIIGTISGFSFNLFNISIELGYGISSRYWNNGLASEAGKEVVRFLFEEVGMHKIYASFEKENEASRKVLEHLDFVYEGTSRDAIVKEDGSYCDLVYYSILNDK